MANKTNKVQLGVTVKLEDLESKKVKEYTIVRPEETQVLTEKISSETPVGNKLLGSKVGDVIEVDVPAGKLKYKVLKITK